MRPPKASPLESAQQAGTRSVQGGDRRGALDLRIDGIPNEALSNDVGPSKPWAPASARGDPTADPRSARPDVAVRVSVVDGADRLVYVDVRDGGGWTRPWAAEQAASDLRMRSSAVEGAATTESRTFRTREMAPPLSPQRGTPFTTVANTPTPYSFGKASVFASASLSVQHQRMSAPGRAPTLQAQAAPAGPTRAR